MTRAAARTVVRTRQRVLLLAVVLLAILAHGAAIAGVLVFDDIHSVGANWALQDTAHWWRWLSDPTAFSASGSMYRPVVLLSLGLNFAIGDSAAVLKAGNVLLHALVAWLAFGWLRRLGVSSVATFGAVALFAVHPLVSEVVNLVSARSELLLFVGLLLALRSEQFDRRSDRWWLASLGIVCGTVIACGSKETGVVVPGLLLAQVVFVRRRPWQRRDWQRTARLVLPAALVVLGYLALRHELLGEATVTLSGRTGDDPLSGHGRSLTTQLATMGLLLPRALLQMVLPVGLSIDPMVTFRHGFADPFVLLGWGSVLGLGLLGLLPGPGAGVRRLGLALTAAVALPWILIPLNMPLAEHRLYGPLLGVLMVTLPWLPRLDVRPIALGGLVLLGGALSTRRALDFRDETRLWQAELAHGDSWRAWWGLGAARLRAGDFAAAVEALANARHRNDRHATVLRNYAEALSQLPDAEAEPWRALVVTDQLLATRADDPWARTLSAQAHLQAGRVTGERRFFTAAEQIALSCLDVAEPKGLVFRIAAAARLLLGDPEGALAHLDRSLAMGLDHVSVRLDRAAVLRQLGRDREAQRELMRAQQQAPTDPGVMQALQAGPPR